MSDGIVIRPFRAADGDGLWAIIEPVLREGRTYALPADWSRDEALAYWLADDKQTYVAEAGDALLGAYYLKANQLGGGAHVCNAGFMTAPAARGKGVARAMGEHAQREAVAQNYTAMQFNFVVSSNAAALRLWQDMGFAVVGRLPRAFALPDGERVDALVLFKELAPQG